MRIGKILRFAALVPLWLILGDIEDGPSTRSRSYEELRAEAGLPDIGSVFFGRDGGWLLSFSALLPIEELRFYQVVADQFGYVHTLRESRPACDVYVCRLNPGRSIFTQEEVLHSHQFPDDYFKLGKFLDGVWDRFRSSPVHDTGDYLVFAVQVEPKEVFAGQAGLVSSITRG